MSSRFALTVSLVLISVVTSVAQESLRSLAQRLGGAATTHVNIDYPGWPLEKMVRSADLIVRGRVTQTTSFLNDDESLVLTDYWISPSEIFKRTSKVDPNIPIVFRRLGGKVRLDGLEMRTTTDLGPAPTIGDECFFLLSVAEPAWSLRRGPGVYESVIGTLGVIPVRYSSAGPGEKGESGALKFAATIRALVAKR